MFESKTGTIKKPGSASQAAATASEQALNFKSSTYSKSIVLDLINLSLTMTNEVLRFLPEVVSIFELQIAPTIEPLLHNRPS